MTTKKDDILAASLVVFQQEGLKGARMERIAQEANVSKRTLYKYFENKEVLFEAICNLSIDACASKDLPEYNPQESLSKQLTDAFEAFVEQTMTPLFLSNCRVLWSEFMRNPEAAKKFQQAYRSTDKPMSRFLAQAMASGSLRFTDPDAATERLFALFRTTIMFPAILHGMISSTDEDCDEIIQESVETFLLQYAPADT